MDLLGRKAKRKLEEFSITSYRYTLYLEKRLSESHAHVERLTKELAELKFEFENSKSKTPPISSQPLYLSETEEDIDYAYRNELIDKDQYEDMLRQLEFDNSEITFDLEAY